MFSRLTGIISALVIIVSALNSADVLAILPPQWATYVTIAATAVLALSRALVDGDKNGIPDIIDRLRGGGA